LHRVNILWGLVGDSWKNGDDAIVPPDMSQGVVGVWTPPDGAAMEFALDEGHLTAHPVGAPFLRPG